MSINFGAKDRVLGLWFGGMEGKDFIACAWIPEGKDEIKLVWRFRDHNSENPWDEKDVKRWYGGSKPGTSTEDQKACISTCDILFHEMAEMAGFTVLDKIGPGSGKETMRAMETKEWCHIRQIPAAATKEAAEAIAKGEMPDWNKIRN